jgi:hypothetical protein
MPSVSRQQQKAMFAAASGNSNIGIPKSVGEDYADADIARGPDKLPAKVHEGKAVKLKDGGIVPDRNKVSDKWGVDLTKWANESDADKMDDRVRNEGNVEAKMELEKQRQAMVDAQGQQPVQKMAAGGYAKGGPVTGNLPMPALTNADGAGVGKMSGRKGGHQAFGAQTNTMDVGGKVPGKGKGDHVAALLEPGELVIPKHEAEKMFKPRNTWTQDEDDDEE